MTTPLSNVRNPFLREYLLCASSFLFFIYRHCKIQDRRTKDTIPFHLWPAQASVAPLFATAKRLIALKARQIGITWLTAAYVLWRAIFNKNELIIIISAKEDLAVEFLDRVKFIFDHLPKYLKPKVFKRTGGELSFGYEEKDEMGNAVLRGLGSVIKSLPSTPDAGQSKTISLLVMDETAINRYNKEIWGAAEPTLEHSDGQAIIISNPTKTAFGWPWTRKIYTESMKGNNDFRRIFLSWNTVPGREVNPKSPNFFLDLQRRKGLDDEDIIMQYPSSEEEAISALTGNFFGFTLAKFKDIPGLVGELIVVNNRVIFEERKRGVLEIWRWPKKGWLNRYCIGSDVGEGLGGNYSVAYVYDRYLQEFVARMRSNRIEADRWADLLALLGVYYCKARIAPERNGPGITTIQFLRRKYPNIYVMRRPGKIKGEATKDLGFYTTDQTKELLSYELKRSYREVFTHVPCAYLLDESSTYIQKEGGQGYGAEDGAYDDCVIAAGITVTISKSMPAAVTVEEATQMGWRDRIWGEDSKGYKIYSVARM